MNYRIEIMKPARKFIERQPKPQQTRLLRAIAGLPSSGDTKPMKGHPGVFRLRVGDYRVIYAVHDDRLLVLVMTAGNRGDVY